MVLCKNTFLYFAYGSNLLRERIHINSPTAVVKAVGVLKGYRLDFNYQSARWKGAVATVVEDVDMDVWGVVWEINIDNLEHLDRQESVHSGIYRPIEVGVKTTTGELLFCRCYELIRPLELDRRPSPIYKEVIIKGAIQNGLPDHYIDRLELIIDNEYRGPVEVNLDLGKRINSSRISGTITCTRYMHTKSGLWPNIINMSTDDFLFAAYKQEGRMKLSHGPCDRGT